ncbi:MAG: NAD(P)-binding domain-containing protein [Prevotella sp.]|jgi:predicted dinucleotide-binding enzyme|nr:NAD(P)-binding domain-containing protein [Prevotella sp.]
MNIGIIGAGNIGGTLARRLSQLGHKVTLSNARGPESLQELAAEINVKAATVYEVIENNNNDIVIITIPQKNVMDLPKDLFEGLKDDLIVIDTCNYYPLMRDGIIDELDGDITNAEWVQAKIKRPMVKTFNSIAFTSLADGGRPKGDKDRIALPLSGDRAKDKEVVSELIDQLGFDPFDLGELKNSWKYEPGTPVYCMDFNLETLKNKLDEMGAVRTTEIREKINKQRTAQEKQILEYFAQQKK